MVNTLNEASPEHLTEPKHRIWFVNEHATSAEQYVDDYRERYEKQGDDATWIATTKDEECTEKLLEAITKYSGDQIELIIAGGDGTLHKALGVLLSRLPINVLHQLVINVVGLGGENDVAHMLHGADYDDLDAIMRGNIKLGRPLLLQKQTMQMVDGQEYYSWQHINTAAYSLGMGATADGAKQANEPEYKKLHGQQPENWLGSLKHKIAMGFAKMKLARKSMQATVNTPNGRLQDFTVASGQRMAGIFNFPSEFTERGFFVSETKDDKLGLSTVLGLTDRLGPKSLGYTGRMVYGSHYFEVKETTLIHVDGENYTLEPGSYKLSESRVPVAFRSALTQS
jgi:diacylglycerol kinase family enzyme